MTNEEMLCAIDRFIQSRMYRYAMLINGKWGSGKTYFVEHVLIPHLRGRRDPKLDVNYISLYGIKTTEEISEMLCMQAIKDKAPEALKNVMDSKGGQVTALLASAAIKMGLSKLSAVDSGIEKVLSVIPNYDNNVVIFDDLERCACSVDEVMGYINHFVEHSDAAVILVANEEEIGNATLSQNSELQMLVAMNPQVNVSLEPSMADIIRDVAKQDDTSSPVSFSTEELERRRKAIFRNNENYRRIKEKVIGLTINYEPDLNTMYTILINDCIGKKAKNDLLHNELLSVVDDLVILAEEENHNNLRTFQYYLEKLSIIYEAIGNQYAGTHDLVLSYTFRSAIRYMKGQQMPEWQNTEYGEQSFNGGWRTVDNVFGFRFIDDLLVNNQIDVRYINDVLSRYSIIMEKKAGFADDPYHLIHNWYVSEDQKVEEWLDKIKNNIRDGVYSTELYTELIRYLAALKTYHVMPAQCDAVFEAMKEYIANAEPSTLEPLEFEHFVLGETAQLYREMREQIEELLAPALCQSEKQFYEDLISDIDSWGTNLCKDSEKHMKRNQHSFVFLLEPDVLLERIKNSGVKELDCFRMALHILYVAGPFYEMQYKDHDHLLLLRKGLDEMDSSTWGQIKTVTIDWLKNDLEKYLKKTEQKAAEQSGIRIG